MLFIYILLLFLYQVDFYEFISQVYETLINLHKFLNLITLSKWIVGKKQHKNQSHVDALTCMCNSTLLKECIQRLKKK